MGADQLQSWAPDKFRDWSSLNAGNRYFSTGTIAATVKIVSFDSLVDPEGILASVDTNRYRHMVNNAVGYFQREKRENGGFR
jgi:hypothetical protein